jgi:hypothetical protein
MFKMNKHLKKKIINKISRKLNSLKFKIGKKLETYKGHENHNQKYLQSMKLESKKE